jgi:UDP-3-O-[3-hydroxymyristoyl] glucosamine N-acyltransferase
VEIGDDCHIGARATIDRATLARRSSRRASGSGRR